MHQLCKWCLLCLRCGKVCRGKRCPSCPSLAAGGGKSKARQPVYSKESKPQKKKQKHRGGWTGGD
jgi:hypothetical protein